MNGARGDVGQRPEDEETFRIPRVGNPQVARFDHPAADGQNVDVDRSRSPSNSAAAAEGAFHRLRETQQLARSESRANRRGRIQERPLARTAHRTRLIYRRNRDHAKPAGRAQPANRLAQGPLAIAKVGAERKIGDRRSTFHRARDLNTFAACGDFPDVRRKRRPFPSKKVGISLDSIFSLEVLSRRKTFIP